MIKMKSLCFLLPWYGKNQRDLPWRKTRDPYRIWVSEVMLQQTQVSRVIDFYEKFLEKFPDIEKLSKASWPHILSAVSGMGYYGRFRNMRLAAKIIVEDCEGEFPGTYGDLRKLPGVGDYTANAILAFAYGKTVPVIDTNGRRVLQYFFGKKTDRQLKKLALEVCPKKKARDFFQALMDYANLELSRISPRPQKRVHENLMNLGWRRPQKEGGRLSFVRVTAGLIYHNRKILIQKRQKGKPHAGYWEFPGGKIKKGEDARVCLKREIKEELGVEVSVRPPFYKSEHTYRDKHVRLSFHRCYLLLGKPKPLEGQTFIWAAPQDFPNYRFLAGDQDVVRYFAEHMPHP